MNSFVTAIILGIVEGLTEFLPISSTGHLILVNRFFYFDENFTKMFDIVIQLGAILAVVAYFWKKLLNLDIWKKIIIGVLPAIIIGALFAGKIEEKLFNPLTVAIMLFLGGLIILWVEQKNLPAQISSVSQISYKTAFLIGIIQCLSMIPGTSRSGATIIGAMLLGCGRLASAEFSFFLAIPTMILASAYSLLKYHNLLGAGQISVLAIGFLVSFLSALAVVKYFIKFIQKNNFKIFGWYRIALGLAVLLFFLLAK